MPVPGWRLRISLHASLPSRSKFGVIRMSLTTTLGSARSAPLDEAVVVFGDADDRQVGLARQHRLHTFPDEHAVVGEEHRDGTHA